VSRAGRRFGVVLVTLGLVGVASVSVRPAATGWAADAPPEVEPALRVRSPDGRVPAGAVVVEAAPYADAPTLEGGPGAGRFVVDEDGPTVAVADASGHVAAMPPPGAPGRRRVVRRPGSVLAEVPTDTDTVVLEAAAPLTGQLRRADGASAAAFVVWAFPTGASGAPWVRRARVDAAGRFRFDTLPARSRWQLVARRADGAWLDLGPADAGADRAPYELPRGATLHGRVLDAEGGGPVAGLRLRWRALEPLARAANGDAAAISAPGPRPTPDDADEDAPPPGGVFPGGVFPGGVFPGGVFPGGVFPDGVLPGGVFPDGVLPGGGVPDGALPDGALPDGALPDGGTRAEATTDASGRFVAADLAPGRYEALLLAPDLLWDGDAPRVEVTAPGTVRLESWWVRRRGAIVGTVEDLKSHRPVAGARVRAVPAPDLPAIAGGLGPREAVRTDEAGRFRVDGLAPGVGWRLVVEAEGRSATTVGPVDVAGGRDERAGLVRLVASWALDVRVVDATGAPLVGARVVASPATQPVDATVRNGPAGASSADAFVRAATTDTEGWVRLRDLAEGDHQVVAEGRGFVAASAIAPEAAPGSSRSVRLEVARTVACEGRVEAVDGRLPPVRVRAVVRDGASFGTAATERTVVPDRAGRFRIDDLPPTPVDIEATSPDGAYLYARREGYVPGSDDALVLPVPTARRVGGTAGNLARDGRPATVRLESLRYDAFRETHRPVLVAQVSLATDGDHAPFAFDGVAPGLYAVRVRQGGRDSGPVPVTVSTQEIDGLEVRLPSPAIVEGLVADTRLQSSAFGATVRLVRLQGEGASPAMTPRAATTDAYGHFHFDDVAPGLWRVEVADHDAVGTETDVRVAEGERVVLPDLRLGFGGRIEGRVADDRTRPVGGLPVRVLRLPDLDELPRIVTRTDGTFRSAPLAAGRYRLLLAAGLADRPGLEADVEVVEGEATTVDFGPTGGSRLDGAVRRRGAPVAGIGVEALAEAARGCEAVVMKAVTDAHGEYHWDGLPEGRYVLRLVDGAVRSGLPVRLGRNDRVTRDLELGEGGIRGVVRSAAGDPVAGAEVVAVPLRAAAEGFLGATSGRVRTRPDGRFELFGLPVARYRLHVTPLNRPTRTVPDVVAEPAGQEPEVEVVLGIGGRLDLRVRDERGRPVMAAEVWVETVSGVALHPRPFYTQGSGRVEIDGLAEGAARVRVHARGYGRAAPVAVVIREGLATPLEATLRAACTLRITVVAGRDPVARARIEVRREGSDELVLPRRALRRPEDTSGFGITPRTGVLVLDDLEEGAYRVTVSGSSAWAPTTVPAYVAPGRPTDVGVTLLPR